MSRPTGAVRADSVQRAIRNGQIAVVFQPVVDLNTQQLFAYEALTRTSAPEFDGPMSLFEAAHEQACVGELGRVVREMALAGCGSHPLFLNIHPAELNEKYVVQPDDPIFRHTEDVYLEITEGVPLSHFRLCKSILGEVRGRGVYLVVDDLGAGYSNLKYIADLEPRVVKLDRDLIVGLVHESRMHRLVKGITILCKEMGAAVVAEGIETAEELAAVRDAGVKFGQGYLLARPAFPPPLVKWPDAISASRVKVK